MEIRQYFLTKNDCYKAQRYIQPKGIMVHSTGADNPYLHRYVDTKDGYTYTNKYSNDWNRSGVGACVHGFIGLNAKEEVGCVQTLPWNMRGWHCGSSGNDTHISFEICEDGLADKDYFIKTRDTAIELCALLCEEFQLDPMKSGVLVDHVEGYELGIASGHSDVRHWWSKFNYTMNDFRKAVQEKMALSSNAELEERISKLESQVNVLNKKVSELTDCFESSSEILEKVERALGDVSMVYATIADVPKWARAEIQELVDGNLISGDQNGRLNIPKSALQSYLLMCRIWKSLK